jgi:uncharacterized protein (TIGR00299 family) protein
MRIALVDPFAGIAGDMFVGALLDAGASFARLQEGLAQLGLEGYEVSARQVMRAGVRATKFAVESSEHHHHRGLTTILGLIGKAGLPPETARLARNAFIRLGEAEARIHGVAVEEVHFHEVGAVDAICDIVGAALCLESLGVDAIHCRSLPLSTGTIEAAHGVMPVPAPATLELLKGRPVHDSGLEGELVTPTGAAMMAAWADAATETVPPFTPRAIGYGAGTRDPERYANVCRVTIGEIEEASHGALYELVCDVDDATPQVLGHLLGRLLEAGALDATLQPVVMKKDRPGTRVTALAPIARIPQVEEILFVEGTTLGVRRRPVERTELPRRMVEVETEHGKVRVKIGEIGGRVVHVAPEYEDCRALARETGRPLREIVRLALAALGDVAE